MRFNHQSQKRDQRASALLVHYIQFEVAHIKGASPLLILWFVVCVAQLKGAEALGKPARELAVIHVSLAATYTDLTQHSKAVEHYRQELALRQGSSAEVRASLSACTVLVIMRLGRQPCFCMSIDPLYLHQECSTWLNIAAAQEESRCSLEDIDSSYSNASRCAQKSGRARLQVR